MNTIQNSDTILLRDGTSQKDRNSDALHTDYVAIEGRSIEELVIEAQRLAKELQFFDVQNKPTGTWESFLVDDPHVFNQNSPEGRRIQQKHWAKELAAYVENPELFYNNAEKKAKLSKPHVVLFMTFLKLMNHIKSKINRLTQKHLDFYFRQSLGLKPKEAVPDVVNVLLELEDSTEYFEIKKGTKLQAGEDEEGNELEYITKEDTVISKAKITQLKSVFVAKESLTIKKVHQDKAKTKDTAFVDMIEMALGHPNPGDTLPDFPAENIEDIFQLNEAVKKENAAAIAYVNKTLFLEREQFDLIFLKHQEEKEGVPTDWNPVYKLLNQAYTKKNIHQRQENLKELHNNEGFDLMLKKVYGNPNPGDTLPLYKGETASLEKVFEDLQAIDNSAEQALEYVEVELLLRKQDFIHVMQTHENTTASDEDKNKVYRILEFSERQLRSVEIPAPEIELLSDIYDTPNSKDFLFSQYDEESESKRFKTFGNRKSSIADHSLKPSEIGFAIGAPVLLLKDGKRTIEVLLDLNLNKQKIKDLQSVFDKNIPFQTYLSSEEQWFTTDNIQYSLGNYVGVASETNIDIEIKDQTITSTDTTSFSITDIGDYIIDKTQKIYEIIGLNDVKVVEVQEVGFVETPIKNVQRYAKDQVYLNALKIKIQLQDNELPVTVFQSPSSRFITYDQPTLVCTLNSSPEEHNGQHHMRSNYRHLVNLALQKVHIRVDVQQMQHNIIENDQGVIDTNKPFEPFGFQPEIGTSFYIANEEISQKQLQDLQLHLEWSKLPKSLVDHYKNYWLIQADRTEEELAALNEEELAELIDQKLGFDAAIIEDDHDFKADIFLQDRNAELLLSEKIEDETGNKITKGFPLFDQENIISINNIPSRIKETNPDYKYKERFGIQTDEDEALLWDRYFRVELTPINFQHAIFNSLSLQQAISEKAEIKKLKINPPYQPKIKSLGVSYTACENITTDIGNSDNANKIFHLHPFGYESIQPGNQTTLIPVYKDEGSLYLGIEQLDTPQILSILFQMAEGSADPEVEKPVLKWSYLHNNEWVELAPSDLLQDRTNGLVNTGIVKIRIPEDAIQGGTIMPSNLHWIKICAFRNIEGVSDTIDICTQVISATLANKTVAPAHFENPLPIDTITEELNQIPGVVKITQPFTSSKGKSKEKGEALYKRISERLRHKNRALTMWDYEHMILNQFPQIYKVKCLPSPDCIGGVSVIVVPDIKGKLPFNPFAPKVGADTLFEINSYIEQLAPTYAEVLVSNPRYLQVSTECIVKFYPGYDEVFYKNKLIEEIKRFMSPWAYGEDSDIQIGGSLHASVIINFIAERPYIDYVANLKLFQSEDGKTFTDVRSLNNGKSIVTPSKPDMIMVAAQLHEVYVVNENGFEEDSFEGINYMEINKDFIVK
ncbi:baseplate J/gp47 family protein [Aquimarina sp. D1M17]|uniref:baseplate J/gp47 family protein n=1 Tax=Aquimarina acroporae TaxID=2937283 RepID=UPI0020BD7DF9|nr:baseplate J/gp47 family protein [Aquimarina acroporae]MCK8521019.1 baseplate J/gp47 family protein [Aquimarina acroporae]